MNSTLLEKIELALWSSIAPTNILASKEVNDPDLDYHESSISWLTLYYLSIPGADRNCAIMQVSYTTRASAAPLSTDETL